MTLFWKRDDPSGIGPGLSRYLLYEHEESPASLVLIVTLDGPQILMGSWFWLHSRKNEPAGLYHHVDSAEVQLMLNRPESWWMERLL